MKLPGVNGEQHAAQHGQLQKRRHLQMACTLSVLVAYTLQFAMAMTLQFQTVRLESVFSVTAKHLVQANSLFKLI